MNNFEYNHVLIFLEASAYILSGGLFLLVMSDLFGVNIYRVILWVIWVNYFFFVVLFCKYLLYAYCFELIYGFSFELFFSFSLRIYLCLHYFISFVFPYYFMYQFKLKNKIVDKRFLIILLPLELICLTLAFALTTLI